MSVIISMDTCRLCKYCTVLKNVPAGEPEGECKGAPPQIVALLIPGPGGQPSISMQTLFPRVALDWTCGAFKPRIVPMQN